MMSHSRIVHTLFLIFFILLNVSTLSANTTFRIMTYNTLNFDGTDRTAYFQTVLSSALPDIVVTQEIYNENACNVMLVALQNYNPNFAKAVFVNDGNQNNMLFYDSTKFTLTDQSSVDTYPRDISEYMLTYHNTTFNIYSCHLKAVDSPADELLRFEAVSALRSHLNNLDEDREFIVLGDMNFYTYLETGYQKFIADESENNGRVVDLSAFVGDWHNNFDFREAHSQSTRSTSFGGGASGGLDDRFDFIFTKFGMNDGQKIDYVTDSYTVYGNDGNHFNQDINSGENSSVPSLVADALYYASDHLPVLADFIYIDTQEYNCFFSEYMEGSSNNKALEIYNPTENDIDLSEYSIKRANNGVPWSYEETLSGVIASEEVYVIANVDADPVILAEADITSTITWFNGNDCIALFKNDALVDIIGVYQEDPITGWEAAGTSSATLNHTLVRKPAVITGNTAWSSSAGSNQTDSEWIVYPNDTFSFLGNHTCDGLPQDIPPEISNIATNPTEPDNTDLVDVTADISDSDGLISSAYVLWGYDDQNLPNQINMILQRDVYISESKIPSQSTGSTIYFQIFSIDNDDNLSESSINSYTVVSQSGITIYDIQYTTDPNGNSNYYSQTVTISGVVTGNISTGYFVQDGMGAWNGIFVFDANLPVQGDNITITGLVDEYYNLTELKDLTSFVINSSGSTVPSPIILNTSEINDEQYEGVLVETQNVECTNSSLGYGEWEIRSFGEAPCRVDDAGFTFVPSLGAFYNVTGVVHFTFGNYKIEPRFSSDITSASGHLPTPLNLTIEKNGSFILIDWDDVPGASIYNVYSSENPFDDFAIDNAGIFSGSSWTAPISTENRFYQVTAE